MTTETKEFEDLEQPIKELESPEEIRDADGGVETLIQAKGLDPDAILDTLVPDGIDWRSTVRRFPIVSVGGVALVGYLVGRTKGRVIIAGVTAALSSAMMNQLSDVFEGDFFDF